MIVIILFNFSLTLVVFIVNTLNKFQICGVYINLI